MSNIGVITEQGDLGLGFDIINESEQEKIRKEIQSEHAQYNDKDQEKEFKK